MLTSSSSFVNDQGILYACTMAQNRHDRRMGLFQDQTDSLSELKRLAALVQDPVRVDEIGSSQWPLAMISYGLATCNDESNLDYSLEIYPRFAAHSSPVIRQRTLSQLSDFIAQRQGDGWRALSCFALADPEAEIRRQAAFRIATLTPPDEKDPFRGVSEVKSLFLLPARRELPSSTPLADALLSLSDRRLLPNLLELIVPASREKLSQTLRELDTTPNSLSGEWLLACSELRPELTEDICAAFCRILPAVEQVIDLVLPLPAWRFKNPSPQILHGWSRSEYFRRILPRLEACMSPGQIERIRAACG